MYGVVTDLIKVLENEKLLFSVEKAIRLELEKLKLIQS